MDKPLVFLKCLIQLISDIASILPDLHCVIVSTPITVEGLGAAGKSFFIICTDFKTVQDSALLRCKTLHFYFAIHNSYANPKCNTKRSNVSVNSRSPLENILFTAGDKLSNRIVCGTLPIC